MEASHISAFVESAAAPADETAGLHWQTEAIARLMRAPQGFMRDAAKSNIERYAQDNAISEITLEVAEKGLEISRQAMAQQVADGERPAPKASKCPFAGKLLQPAEDAETAVPWAEGAKSRLAHIPDGYCRNMTYQAIESIAAQTGREQIDIAFIESILDTFQKGSAKVVQNMPWQAEAETGIANVPDMVRGMLIEEIEIWARQHGRLEVDADTVAQVKQHWSQTGRFHLDPADPRNDG